MTPIIVTALFGKEDFAYFDGLRRTHFPPERNQAPAHLTLFHHLPPSVADELKRRLSDVAAGSAPQAWLAGTSDLGNGVAFRVESPDLAAIRADLANAFGTLLVPQDAAGWRPHVTVQNKVARDAAKALHANLSESFKRRPLTIAGLASWWYRGGPWEPLSRHMFARGGSGGGT